MLIQEAATMNKVEAREYANAQKFMQHGMADTAARTMSALIRSCRTQRSYIALMTASQEMGITNQPEFII
jgi:hypothetical protein